MIVTYAELSEEFRQKLENCADFDNADITELYKEYAKDRKR